MGAGGHARVVLDALALSKPEARVKVYDEAARARGAKLLGRAVHRLSAGRIPEAVVHVAIGDAGVRRRIAMKLEAAGAKLLSILHPAACVAAAARVGPGCFMAAQSVVAPGARLGRGVIVNHGAVVDHDCRVGDWSHVAPHVTLGGGVVVGRAVLVGAGAVVLPGVRIGERAVVGAGAVVTADVAAGSTVAGVPAKRSRRA